MELLEVISQYSDLILIGNSAEALRIDYGLIPEEALVVFFNRAHRILKRGPVDRDAMLVVRQMNPNKLLDGPKHLRWTCEKLPRLRAVTGLLAGPGGAQISTNNGPHPLPHLIDYNAGARDFYPNGRSPTTGFAFLQWLLKNFPDKRVQLRAFTGVPDEQFSMNPSHDWIFEQASIRLLERAGRLRTQAGPQDAITEQLRRAFPTVDEDLIDSTVIQTIMDRSRGLERRLGRLWSISSPVRWFKAAFRPIRRLVNNG